MNIRTFAADMWNDTRAVSPVVATLVLIVVAITGAAGVALMQGQFASEVAEDTNTEELSTAAATELIIAGSTTVQPVSELLAEAYMHEHKGTRITVQGGGSGAGISSAGLDIVDIGAASRNVKPETELVKYPDLETYTIGGSAVVMIVESGSGVIGATKSDINELYVNGTNTALNTVGITDAYDRAESSGTEDAFCKWIGNTSFHDTVSGKNGNANVLAAVIGNSASIGFVDFGFADGNDKVTILTLDDSIDVYTADDTNITTQLKTDGTYTDTYPKELARPLNYITNGYPSVMEQGFIDFARSPASATYFTECGYFAITEFA